jgi:hypothetical protein
MDYEANLSKYRPQMLSILRIVLGLLFMSHGLQKFPVANPMFANLQLFSMLGIAGLIEIIGGALFTIACSHVRQPSLFRARWLLRIGISRIARREASCLL